MGNPNRQPAQRGRRGFQLQWVGVPLLALGLLLWTALVPGQSVTPDKEPDDSTSETQESAKPAEPPAPRQSRSISDAIDQAVSKVDERRGEPCQDTDSREVPCFPVSVEAKGERRRRINRALERLRRENADTGKGPMGPDPLALPRSTPTPSLTAVTIDPVCAIKSLIKGFKGENQHYYLYRVKGIHGESVALRERPLKTAGDDPRAPLEFTLLGEYDGDCEAVAAHSKALRELHAEQRAREADEGELGPEERTTEEPSTGRPAAPPLMPVD